nr:ShlB/FhaC/HecB family hemolysin secretion/activation protein [uncultured Pseudodesulfovibrio sp.]
MIWDKAGAAALFFCALLFVFPGSALAQSVQDAGRVQERIIQREEERRRILQEQLEQQTKQPPSGVELQKEPPVEPIDGATCFDVRRINLTGVTLIPVSILDDLTSEYTGRCLTLADINELLKAITNEYVARGYVTSRAYLPEQDISSGILELKVIEGRIEDITLNDGIGKQNQLLGPFMGLVGDPLNLRDLEQGLDQFNRLASNNATMKLVPGNKPGQSIVAITNDPDKRWRISLGWDDSGQDSTGTNQYSPQFEKDNFIGFSDMLSLNYSATPLPWESSRRAKNSQSLSAYWALPLGYWTVSLFASKFNYNTILSGMTQEFSNKGETCFQSLGIDRVIHRDADSKTSLGIGVEHRKVESWIEDVRLVASSYETTDVGLKASHTRRLLGGSLSMGLEYHWGADFLGSSEPLDGEGVPTPQYTKWEGNLNYYHPISFGGQSLMWSSILRAQYSHDSLYSAERMSIGSRYTVRGFSIDSLSGDSGGYIRNELSWRLPFQNYYTDKISACELFAGYDYGMILRDENDPYERGCLQGIALGLRTFGKLSASATIAKAIAAPDFLEKENFEIYSAVTVTF